MTEITRKDPHIILTVDGYVDIDYGLKVYGYDSYYDSGTVSRIPCWGGYGTMKNYTALKTLATMSKNDLWKTIIKWRNPFSPKRLAVTRLDTGKSVEFVHTSPSVSELSTNAPFFTNKDQYTEIPLIFDPPPDYYLDPVTGEPI